MATLCPTYEDPALCEAVISTHWAVIALAMYPTFFDPKAICVALQACPALRRNLVKEWTCEECANGIRNMGPYLETLIPDIVDFLKASTVLSLKKKNHF